MKRTALSLVVVAACVSAHAFDPNDPNDPDNGGFVRIVVGGASSVQASLRNATIDDVCDDATPIDQYTGADDSGDHWNYRVASSTRPSAPAISV